ncbi:NAD-dependent epimerase/dehydratase family protein [Dictyobacter formicarum]|uniref:dTDP-glucose 4,6-dehydratase n=1 Tax=Dictyobacter formicarum TaxID=2778368 RepID=A0ABQ3VJV8_9CHLR|nr:NAD(P)-dependent oxidoreductase [Dictyobacter formicarum]GHO85653.1 dTDP-glucose 4,6-dehydratase [Dictyobacter formicarum]
MRIFVIGATGVLGRVLMPRLQQAHHDIRTLVRSSEQAQRLQAVGIEATVGELLQAETQQRLPELIKGCEAVIHIATAIPSNPYDLSAGNWETTTRLRTEGTRHLLASSLQAGAARYIQQSITMAYTDGGDAWLDEDQPFDTSLARAAICGPIVEMERMVRAVPAGRLQWSILRGGLFVGPGTGQEKLLERLRAGQVEIPGQGQNFLSPIHVADMAEAIALTLEHASGGSIYHIVDQPLRYGDYITGLADRLHLSYPPYNASLPEAPSYRCGNQHAREQLGWQPQHTIWPGSPSW